MMDDTNKNIFYLEVNKTKSISNVPMNLTSKQKILNSIKGYISSKDVTYYYFNKGLVDIVFYKDLDKYKEYNNIVTFEEYCRTEYLLNKRKDIVIYLNPEHNSLVKIKSGVIINSNKFKDYKSFIEFANELEKTTKIQGEKYIIFSDSILENIDSEEIIYNKNEVFKKIKDSQKLNKINFFKSVFSKYKNKKSKEKERKVEKLFFKKYSLYFLILIGFSFLLYLFLDIKSEIKDMKKEQAFILKSISNSNKNTNSFKSQKEVEKNKKYLEKIFFEIREVQDRTNKVQEDVKDIKDNLKTYVLSKTKKSSNSSKKYKIKSKLVKKTKINENRYALSKKIPYFYCKPVIINKDSVFCNYKGVTIKIDKKEKDIDGYHIKYIPEKKVFVTRLGHYIRYTTLEMADRGF